MAEDKFSKWATGFSGCDGGDIGNHNIKSIWFCGIEWGGGHPADEEELCNTVFSKNVDYPDDGYSKWNENLSYIFNWQAMKLLSAIKGGVVESYKDFAEKNLPFTRGGKGYFKMNLYPLAFKNTSHALWESGFAKATGLENKQEYISWIRLHRFPILKSWADVYAPKLIVCVGKSYIADFSLAFADQGLKFNCEEIDDRELNWGINKNGTLVVVIPFMVNRNGLTRNISIQKFGNRIREILLRIDAAN